MKNIEEELVKAWNKAQTFPGKLSLLGPNDLEPNFAAQTIIDLLQQTYVSHGISQNPIQVELDIKNRQVEPWILTRNDRPVACAALVHQGDGSVEIGRAVSIENGSGAGKIAMLEAVQNRGSLPLVAEVRLAGQFANVPGSEATQKICLGLFELIPHAFLPAFNHGSPNRNELFGFSTENTKLIDHRPILTARKTISDRATFGSIGNLKLVQIKPFRVAVRDDNGADLISTVKESRSEGSACTLIPLEVTDNNMGTISALLNNEFTIAGLDRKLGPNKLPIIWLSTIGIGTLLAPTQTIECLPRPMRNEIEEIGRTFSTLAGRT